MNDPEPSTIKRENTEEQSGDPEHCRIKLEDTEEFRGWCLFLILQ